MKRRTYYTLHDNVYEAFITCSNRPLHQVSRDPWHRASAGGQYRYALRVLMLQQPAQMVKKTYYMYSKPCPSGHPP